MEQSFHHLLLITETLFQKKVVGQAAEMGLLPGQSKILDYLQEHDGCEQKALGQVFCLEAATVTGILQRMEQAGLVRRQVREGNRKSQYVYLTPSGREAAVQVRQLFSSCESSALEGLSPEQIRQLLELLAQIYQNLTKEANH